MLVVNRGRWTGFMALALTGCMGQSVVGVSPEASAPDARVFDAGRNVDAASASDTDSEVGSVVSQDETPLPDTLPPVSCHDVPFEDITVASGITFVQHTTHPQCIHDVMGTGGCLLDYDLDGDLDVYLIDRAPWPSRMYRNDGHGHFTDVTDALHIGDIGPSMGCLAFDVDGDGDEDIYITRNDSDRLYRNDRTGFTDITPTSGIVTHGVGSSATAGDIDGDGDLDLFVGRMVDETTCPGQCVDRPQDCQPEPNVLFVNDGHGHFTDVTHARGINLTTPTLAVRFWDMDRDGALDIYVGNDLGSEPPYYPDQFWRNDGTGHFTDAAPGWGLDHDQQGHSGDTMGVSISDIDLDGAPDLVSTDINFGDAMLYHCDAALHCDVQSSARGLDWSLDTFKWAADFEDFDRDGWPDLLIINGGYYDPVAQLSQLYWNNQGTFALSDLHVADPLAQPRSERAALYGDIDGDGLLDVILTGVGEAPRVLRSRRRCGRGIAVALDSLAAGARVRVTANGHSLEREVVTSASYEGSGSPWLYFGMGTATHADVDVQWLDGTHAHVASVSAEQVLHIPRPALE